MVQCNNCRTSLPKSARFCPTCGQDLRAQSDTTTATSLSDPEKTPTQPLLAPNDANQTLPAAPSDTATFLSNHEKNLPTEPPLTPNKRQFISPIPAPSLQPDFTGTPEAPFEEADLTYAPNEMLTDSPTELGPTPSDFLLDQAPKPPLKNSQTFQDNGGHQQPQIEHGPHQQPHLQHGTHLQPQAQHGTHQQPHLQHGTHLQPQVEHGAHQQPHLQHGTHLQPQVQHGAHQQAYFQHGAHQQAHGIQPSPLAQQGRQVRRLKLSKSFQPSYLTVSISSVAVIASLVVAVVLLLPHIFHSEAANPEVNMPDIVDLGQIASLKGSNFAPHSQVIIAIDTQPSITQKSSTAERPGVNGNILDTLPLPMMQQPTQHMQSGQGYMTVPVGDNGTIQTSLYIDAHWWPGSRHILYVLGQNGKVLVRKQFFVRNTLSAPALVLCSNSQAGNSSAAVTLGPAVEGDSKTVTTVFTLCTQGSGNVDWTGGWDMQNNPWLHLNQSGHIQAPDVQKLQISASAASLQAGTYTTTVTFNTAHSQGNTGTIQLQVTLLVQKNNNTCLKTNAQTLTFTSTPGQATPSPQMVTLLNCANKEDWSASVTTTDGAGWLEASPTNGNLDSGASNNLTVSVKPANLAVGTYSGSITVGSGSSAVQINVTYVVQEPPPPCISTNPTSLSFTAEQGFNPSPQSFTVDNCGGTGTITTNVSTNNSGSWLSADSGGTLNASSQLGINVSVNTQGLSKGEYTGSVNVALKDTNGATTSKQVSVKLTITPPPCITANPTSLSFAGEQGGKNPGSQSFTISNCGSAGTITTSVSTDNSGSWLAADSGGTLNASSQLRLNVSVNTQGLSAGSYTGSVNVTLKDANGATATQQVSVKLTITNPCTISVNPTSLTFTAEQGGNNPSSQSFKVTSSSGCTGTVTTNVSTTDGGSWLHADSGGTLSSSGQLGINVSVNIQGLSVNQYTGSVNVTLTDANGGTATQQVTVNLQITPGCGDGNQLALTFTAEQGGSNPPSQNITVTSTCSGTITTSVGTTDGKPWLSATGGGHIDSSTQVLITVSVNIQGLSVGQYTGYVKVILTDANGAHAQAQANVTLNIQTSQSTPTPSPTPIPQPTPTPTPVPQATPTPTPVPTPTPTPVPTPVPTPTPIPVATPTPTPIPVATPTPTPIPVVPTPTPTPIPVVPTPTPTPIPIVPTPTPIPVPTPTPTYAAIFPTRTRFGQDVLPICEQRRKPLRPAYLFSRVDIRNP